MIVQKRLYAKYVKSRPILIIEVKSIQNAGESTISVELIK